MKSITADNVFWLLHGPRTRLPASAWNQNAGRPRQNQSALRIAEFLSRGCAWHYPMLKTHPGRVGQDDWAGAGGVLSFEVEGTGADACKMTKVLQSLPR